MALLIQACIGLFAGLLGGLLGVGGSIIIIPALVLYLSQTGGYAGSEQHLLQAAAMICNVFVAAPSVVAHARAEAIVKRVVGFLIPSALVGILLGVRVSNSAFFARENGALLAILLASFMVYVAAYNTWRLFRGRDTSQNTKPPRSASPTATGFVGLVMGVTAGLLGIGGGALCVPLQQIVLKMPLRRAIANSATTIVCVSAIGACYKNATLSTHGVPVPNSVGLALTLIPTAIIGGYLGGRLTHVLPQKALRVVFIIFMMTMAYLTFDRARDALPKTSQQAASDNAAGSW